eukprot:CAMPEP_0113605284 /NCGR_PEP_ID=MMETSP0017_2-20120614/2247_1 /TAXON_ID=2856 /ORGANISM="Cylindrotheca closterium" /LENGTH=326 /DNA_ID=CAMNT_0000513767 /DNA_START=325 /DNA_END=1305 /DNA_ORIENTATION=+ /assembly_acc=CAM_ASM_000147
MATDTNVKFPGFQVHNTVLNGCKLHYDKKGRPSYTFCLIGDHKAVKGGNPSLVWLVKKLTGMSSSVSKSQDDEFSLVFEESETIAKTQIHIIPEEEGRGPCADHDSSIKLQMNIEFATHVRFPESFLNILPMSKEKVEQKGAHSIRKVVEKDATDALKAVREAWMLSSSSSLATTNVVGESSNNDNESSMTIGENDEEEDLVVPHKKIPVGQRIRSFRRRFVAQHDDDHNVITQQKIPVGQRIRQRFAQHDDHNQIPVGQRIRRRFAHHNDHHNVIPQNKIPVGQRIRSFRRRRFAQPNDHNVIPHKIPVGQRMRSFRRRFAPDSV